MNAGGEVFFRRGDLGVNGDGKNTLLLIRGAQGQLEGRFLRRFCNGVGKNVFLRDAVKRKIGSVGRKRVKRIADGRRWSAEKEIKYENGGNKEEWQVASAIQIQASFVNGVL